MSTQTEQSYQLLTRASDSRCKNCPPDRVCAWACIQGAGINDIMVGAVLEQSQSWALEENEPGLEPVQRALMDMFNG